MIHKGKSFAVYASTRRAFLVQPGQQIPTNTTLRMTHTDMKMLCSALLSATKPNKDEKRKPSYEGFRSFYEALESFLCDEVQDAWTDMTLTEFKVMRHALGATHLSAYQPDLGWRNYFQIDTLEGADGDAIKSLVEKKLMEEYSPGYYRVTKKGMFMAGAPIPEVAEEAGS